MNYFRFPLVSEKSTKGSHVYKSQEKVTNPISLPELRAMAERAKSSRDKSDAFMGNGKTWDFAKFKKSDELASMANADDFEMRQIVTPDAVLRLVAVAEAAESIRTLANVQVKEYPDGKRFVSFDPHAVNLLPLMVALAGLREDNSGDGCPCCQGGNGVPCMTCVMAVRMARRDEP